MEAKEKTRNMYFEDLEVLREEKADFVAYYNLLMDGVKNLKGNDMAGFIYGVLQDVKNLGAEEQKQATKLQMIEKVNEL